MLVKRNPDIEIYKKIMRIGRRKQKNLWMPLEMKRKHMKNLITG